MSIDTTSEITKNITLIPLSMTSKIKNTFTKLVYLITVYKRGITWIAIATDKNRSGK